MKELNLAAFILNMIGAYFGDKAADEVLDSYVSELDDQGTLLVLAMAQEIERRAAAHEHRLAVLQRIVNRILLDAYVKDPPRLPVPARAWPQ